MGTMRTMRTRDKGQALLDIKSIVQAKGSSETFSFKSSRKDLKSETSSIGSKSKKFLGHLVLVYLLFNFRITYYVISSNG